MRILSLMIVMSWMLFTSLQANAQSEAWAKQDAASWHSPPIARTKPILDPSSGSYYQLYYIESGSKMDWWIAQRASNELLYNGRRGQLATIKSGDTHFFLMSNFSVPTKGGKFWIGLRMSCATKGFTWEDGHKLSEQQFSAWTANLYRNEKVSCHPGSLAGAPPYLPVSLVSSDNSFRWEISGPRKWYNGMLVEFPKPAE